IRNETGLFLACSKNYEDIVLLLINLKANLNDQTNNTELSALHMTVVSNNLYLCKTLIDNGANLNIQDVNGNTILHYALNYETVSILNDLLKNYSSEFNFNLFNAYEKLPIHILFDKYDIYKDSDLVEIFIKNSNLNFQDKLGMAPIHYIAKLNISIKYKNILINKKINIYLKDKSNNLPIDYIDDRDKNESLEIIVDSYLFRLSNKKYAWTENWQQYCQHPDKYKLDKKYKNKSCREICREVIENDLKRFKEGDYDYPLVSYPIVGKPCILFDLDDLEISTFTGTTLDVLIGLLYLYGLHDNVCPIINT